MSARVACPDYVLLNGSKRLFGTRRKGWPKTSVNEARHFILKGSSAKKYEIISSLFRGGRNMKMDNAHFQVSLRTSNESSD